MCNVQGEALKAEGARIADLAETLSGLWLQTEIARKSPREFQV